MRVRARWLEADALGRSSRRIELHTQSNLGVNTHTRGHGAARLWDLANVASLEFARIRRVGRILRPFWFARSKWNHPRIFSHLLVRHASEDPAGLLSFTAVKK